MILDAAGDQVVLHAPGYLLVLAIVLPVAGVLISFVLGGRNAERTALCVIPLGLGVVAAILYEVSRAGKNADLCSRRLAAAARHSVARRWSFGCMLATHRARDRRHGTICARRLPHAEGVTEARSPLVFWTLSAGSMGRAECRLPRQRPFQSLRGSRAADFGRCRSYA